MHLSHLQSFLSAFYTFPVRLAIIHVPLAFRRFTHFIRIVLTFEMDLLYIHRLTYTLVLLRQVVRQPCFAFRACVLRQQSGSLKSRLSSEQIK